MTVRADGLKELIDTFDRMSRGLTFEQAAPLEALFTEVAGAVEAKIHVSHEETAGQLKASFEATSGMDGTTWWGQVETTDRGGIFELARGHSHHYLEPMVEAEDLFQETAMDCLEAWAVGRRGLRTNAIVQHGGQ